MGNWMTVGELIDHLKTMPEDAVCIYQRYSEYSMLRRDEVKVSLAAEQSAEAKLRYGFDDMIVKHNGMYMRYDSVHWPEGSTPEFVSVCKFPGN